MRRIDAAAALAGRYDIVVVGAGPAGLAAAARADALGLSVLIADENPGPGGQIHRAAATTPLTENAIPGDDRRAGLRLVEALGRSAADHAQGCAVWSVALQDAADPSTGFEVGLSLGGEARAIGASHLILATGALERPCPIPGWTLPGVMTAGAAQIALKTAGLVPAGRTVLAGCGPLLYLLAAQLVAAGADIVALLDTTQRANWRRALPQAADFLRSPYLWRGLRLAAAARLRTPFRPGVTGLAALGEDCVSAVSATFGGRSEIIPCETLLLHHGVIPGVNLSSAAGCALAFDDKQHCWTPVVDPWFASSVPGVSIAGDAAAIGGAETAALRGEIAALEAARRLGRLDIGARDRLAAPMLAELRRCGRGRRFLDLLFRPAPQFLAPEDDGTIVCRCEEVTAGQIRDAARRLGAAGPNQMKAFLRCGMGPCQGRLCGPTVVDLIAQTRGVPPAEVGYFRLRPPVKPVTLAELAALPAGAEAVRAVER